MINYVEKGIGLHDAIRNAGHWLIERNNVWISSNDDAVQAIINAYDPIPKAKELKIAELKAEGLRRIQLVFPAIDNFETLLLVKNIILSIAPAARQLTASMTSVSNIYDAGVNAQTAINAMTDLATIEAYNVSTQPVWP